MIYYRKVPVGYFKRLKLPIVAIKNRGKHQLRYIQLYSGFDIETTNLDDVKRAYMYIWQMSIGDDVILGRKWSEFVAVIRQIEKELSLRNSTRVIIWIANLSFEFQFLRRHFRITEVFAKTNREPLYSVIDDCIELRDCLPISGGSLASLAEQYTRTKKLVGDLDYEKKRNSLTAMTRQELMYCINDVKILSEWSEYIFNEYIIPKKFVPMTKTGLLRRKVKGGMPKTAKDMIYTCYPPTYSDYKKMMVYAFQGGITHANRRYSGKVIPDTHGADITSSYPSAMLTAYYPVSPFIESEAVRKDKCCLIDVTYYGITAVTTHSIISRSKCMECEGAVIDNGRILKADKIRVYITEIDLELYDMYYKYETAVYNDVYTANRGYLPRYLIDPILTAYARKNELKKTGKGRTKEYAEQKSYVNSGYGMTVTKLVEQEVTYIDGEWGTDTTSFDYDGERKKAFLLPQWGVWVTAHARYALLSVIRQFADDVIYYDTDSIKFVGEDNIRIIDGYNKKADERLKNACERLNISYVDYKGLGSYDMEYIHAEKFKTLGAKRYIYTKDGTHHVTVAGLPKGTLERYAEEKSLDIYEVFCDGMEMYLDISGKLTTRYNDERHSDCINGKRMTELSSVCLYKIPFKMTLDKFYASLIYSQKEDDFKYEERRN